MIQPSWFRLRRPWTPWHILGALALAALSVLIMRRAWFDIFQIARGDEEASHILLVPIVAAWLIWVRRERLRMTLPKGQWIGPLIVAAGWTCSWYGFHHGVQAAWHLGAILVLVGCLLTVLGRDVLLRFLPAFLVLAFMVPVPGMIRQKIAGPMMDITAQVTHAILITLDIPAERFGNALIINGVNVTIAEACNGMRMVFALVLVSYCFAFGTSLRQYVRLLILIASPLSAILCNVIRLIPTVWIFGHFSNNFAHTFHDISGWLMLPVAFLILLGIIRLLRWALLPVAHFTLAYE
ncbi:MAG: exosortase/archaeosortase family protein [Phycisphaeraceae bacterium]|nr:exosortase/archaeosortase family protein [Phycisphaeraceae bacterium]